MKVKKVFKFIGGIMMSDKEETRMNISAVARRTSGDWDNYLAEKIAELRQLVDEYNISLGKQAVK